MPPGGEMKAGRIFLVQTPQIIGVVWAEINTAVIWEKELLLSGGNKKNYRFTRRKILCCLGRNKNVVRGDTKSSVVSQLMGRKLKRLLFIKKYKTIVVYGEITNDVVQGKKKHIQIIVAWEELNNNCCQRKNYKRLLAGEKRKQRLSA